MTSTDRRELRTKRFPLRLILVAAAATSACRSTPSVAPVPVSARAPVPAVRACPAPDLGQVGWVFVADSTGVLLALPPGFHERASGGPPRHFESADGYRPYMSFGVIRADLGLAAYRRAYQPELMRDYSECPRCQDSCRMAGVNPVE